MCIRRCPCTKQVKHTQTGIQKLGGVGSLGWLGCYYRAYLKVSLSAFVHGEFSSEVEIEITEKKEIFFSNEEESSDTRDGCVSVAA